MSSCEDAIAVAEAAGFAVERLLGLDRPSPDTTAYFSQSRFDHWTHVPLDCGDLGHSRNALARAATGDAMAFLDADDLFSENWLAEAGAMLAHDPDLILHPELNWLFDGARVALWNPDPESPLYTPHYWRVGNYYDSMVVAPRRTFIEIPYRGRDKARGLGFEDWCWNLETMAAGWRHKTVRDTIIFKRRRDNSLVQELRQNKSVLWELEMLAIDKLGSFAPPKGQA